MPKIRNGSNNSQTIGYNTSASKASGQHKTSKMHHSKIFTVISSLQFRGPLRMPTPHSISVARSASANLY